MKGKKIVTHTPLLELWDDDGPIAARRKRYLTLEDVRSMLCQYAVEFVVAEVGTPLKWIPVHKCFDFWRSEVKSHLVTNPDEGFLLEDFPNEYAYVASEWSGELQTPVVVLEMYH